MRLYIIWITLSVNSRDSLLETSDMLLPALGSLHSSWNALLPYLHSYFPWVSAQISSNSLSNHCVYLNPHPVPFSWFYFYHLVPPVIVCDLFVQFPYLLRVNSLKRGTLFCSQLDQQHLKQSLVSSRYFLSEYLSIKNINKYDYKNKKIQVYINMQCAQWTSVCLQSFHFFFFWKKSPSFF